VFAEAAALGVRHWKMRHEYSRRGLPGMPREEMTVTEAR
jgi:hypothetical protein